MSTFSKSRLVFEPGKLGLNKRKREAETSLNPRWLPSSTINILLENREYMAMMKGKLLEIKRVYRNLKSAPVGRLC